MCVIEDLIHFIESRSDDLDKALHKGSRFRKKLKLLGMELQGELDSERETEFIEGEEWRPIKGFEGVYDVSDHGRVRSLDRVITTERGVPYRIKGKLRKLSRDIYGYRRISLYDGSRQESYGVHRLVLQAFAGGPSHPDDIGRHMDGNPGNNKASNLKWGTHKENSQDAIEKGENTGENNASAIMDNALALEIANAQGLASEVSERLGVPMPIVSAVRSGRSWSSVTGIKHAPSNVTITAEIAAEIAEAHGSVRGIAGKFSVHESMVRSIQGGRSWSHVTGIKHDPRKPIPDETILAIASAEGSNSEVAKRFDVTDGIVQTIRSGKAHSSVTGITRERFAKDLAERVARENAKVLEIAKAEGPVGKIAELFGVHPVTVSSIKNGHTHTEITGISEKPKRVPSDPRKMSREQILEVSTSDESAKDAASRLGVSVSTVHHIRNGRIHPDVTGIMFEKGKILSKDAVLEIANTDTSEGELAEKFDVHVATIRNVRTGRTWSKLTGISPTTP